MKICKLDLIRILLFPSALFWLIAFSLTGYDIFITLSVGFIWLSSAIGFIERIVDLRESGEDRLYVRHEDLPKIKESIEQLEEIHKTKAI